MTGVGTDCSPTFQEAGSHDLHPGSGVLALKPPPGSVCPFLSAQIKPADGLQIIAASLKENMACPGIGAATESLAFAVERSTGFFFVSSTTLSALGSTILLTKTLTCESVRKNFLMESAV